MFTGRSGVQVIMSTPSQGLLHTRGKRMGLGKGIYSYLRRSVLHPLFLQLSMTEQRQSISVFWDGECIVPSHPLSQLNLGVASLASARPVPGLSGFQIVRAIRSFTETLGLVTTFKLYTDLEGQNGPSPSFRSQVQCAGVTLVDTASQGRVGAASKMIIGDPSREVISDYHRADTRPFQRTLSSNA